LFRADANFPVSLPVHAIWPCQRLSICAPRRGSLRQSQLASREGRGCAPRMRFKDLERGVSIICELEYSPADTLALNQRIPGSMATAAFTATVETLTED
jgi:hypothetical protein